MPSSSIDSCAALNAMLPLSACGHTKRPRSSRLANRHSPSPSNHKSFTRSPRRPRNTKMCPEKGFSASAVCASAASPSMPLRISVTPAATQKPVEYCRQLPTIHYPMHYQLDRSNPDLHRAGNRFARPHHCCRHPLGHLAYRLGIERHRQQLRGGLRQSIVCSVLPYPLAHQVGIEAIGQRHRRERRSRRKALCNHRFPVRFAEIPPTVTCDPAGLPSHHHRTLLHLGVHSLNLVDTIVASFAYANKRAFTVRLPSSWTA